MGSSFSRGRKYSPTKNFPEKNPSAMLEHAKYCSDDASEKSTDFIEAPVCDEADLEENSMKVFDFPMPADLETRPSNCQILLIKQNGRVFATGNKCAHYGAPLVQGYLGHGRVRCPWHGACFNIETGDIEEFPGLDSIPSYETNIVNGRIMVKVDKNFLGQTRKVKLNKVLSKPLKTTFVVVGGGAAGAKCVETLRNEGYEGRIVFIVAEKHLPYDRVKLSKSLNIDPEQIVFRSKEFYAERNIEILQGVSLIQLDLSRKYAALSNASALKYDKIFIATGCTPKTLRVQGCDLKNIFTLRSLEDAKEIYDAVDTTSDVVIVGGSFIGMEVASYLTDKVANITVVCRDTPFKRTFGTVVGKRIMKFFEEKKVQFRLKKTVAKFEGEDGVLKSVILNDEKVIPATVCLLAIGGVCNTNFLRKNEAEFEENASLSVNEYLQLKSNPEVYIGGDIAYAPIVTGSHVNIGHWGVANYHGHMAALNMMDRNKEIKTVPFFWTVLYGKSFRFAGFSHNTDEVLVKGSLQELKFIAFYCDSETVEAVLTVNCDPLAAKFAEMLHNGDVLIKSNIDTWATIS